MSYSCANPSSCNAGPLGPSLADACPGSALFVFMSLLNTLVLNNEKISKPCQRIVSKDVPQRARFDFVVVGAGAAGSVVATRLSEMHNCKILLLEAGSEEPAGTQVPGFATKFLGTNIGRNYKTTNESHACLATNGSCPWTSGINVGGNMLHNGMIYLRGHPLDYDKWADMGNPGWAWADLKPFFLMSEKNGETDRVGTYHHGTQGPVHVERFPYKPPFADVLLEAAQEAGYGVSEDLNGDKKTGFSIVQATNNKGVRVTSASAFLWPARHRRNLHVSLNSTVTKLIIENGKVIGLEYLKDGETRSVSVTKEVILSAGVIESPHILLLSGIGPKDHLESMGIPVVKDVPGVGENLHDHPCANLNFSMNGPKDYNNSWDVAAEYVTNQSGPLSAPGTIQTVGMMETNWTTHNRPDIELYIFSFFPSCDVGETEAPRSNRKVTGIFQPSILYPTSRGRITLKSKKPTDQPIIWCNYLATQYDIDRMVDAIKMTIALTKTEILREYNVTVFDGPVEACANHQFESDQYWACVARQANHPTYHQGGTCKMGPASDPMAVVDNRLRVHGIQGLRVADNSIMPEVPASNTAAPAMMIGERCAHMVKEDWGNVQA